MVGKGVNMFILHPVVAFRQKTVEYDQIIKCRRSIKDQYQITQCRFIDADIGGASNDDDDNEGDDDQVT